MISNAGIASAPVIRLMANAENKNPNEQTTRRTSAEDFGIKRLARCSSRIALVERPIDKAIEKHRRGARENHANQDEQQNTRGWMTVGCDHERTKCKWQRKDSVRKANQSQKARDGMLLFHHFSVSIAVPQKLFELFSRRLHYRRPVREEHSLEVIIE